MSVLSVYLTLHILRSGAEALVSDECGHALAFVSTPLVLDGTHRQWERGFDDPRSDHVVYIASLSPVRDPSNPTRARWIFELELECNMAPHQGEDEASDTSDDEDAGGDDEEGKHLLLGRDQFVSQLERLHWI